MLFVRGTVQTEVAMQNIMIFSMAICSFNASGEQRSKLKEYTILQTIVIQYLFNIGSCLPK